LSGESEGRGEGRGLNVDQATILPRLVGRTAVKRKVAGSKLVSVNFSICTLLAVVRFVGTWGGIAGMD
jgi:hypothetical protein